MRNASRRPAVLVLLAMVATLLGVITPTAAQAAESIPALKWPAVNAGTNYPGDLAVSPTGSVTLPCSTGNGGTDLRTWNTSGQLVQDISRTSTIDGVTNCIMQPAVGKNGDTYGVPYGKNSSNTWLFGPNLLAYSGNTLKWKYPAYCANDTAPAVAVGADGNIYMATYGHLIGLAADLKSGQTQPDKVLDVSIPKDCSIKLFPYGDGIMLHGDRTSGARFYSYTGNLVSTTTGLQNDEKVNDHGRLFTWSAVVGSYRSINVSVYDPNQNQVMWTTSASTPGAGTSGGPNLYPMKDGGVAVLTTEQKMVSGVPASPTEWVKGLTVINAAGVVTRSFQFSNTYSSGGVTGNFGTAWNILADNTGKLTVVRDMSVNTGSSPATVPGIFIGVYDSVSGSWTYQQVMTGDFAKSGGPNGYALNYGDNNVKITDNTVYLTAKCTNNCTSYDQSLYAIQATGLGKDYPRAEVTNTSARSAAAYVALGDSFSSGEGVSPFEAATNLPNVNTCHRSTTAYARLIAGTSSKIPSLGTGGFRACSGAVSNNIWNNGQWNEGIQLDWWPDTTTQVVTLTIGGNDIGFSDFAKECVLGTCQIGSTAYNTALDKINNVLPSALTATYQKILAAFPNAKIFVMDYPQVIAAKTTSDPLDSRCVYMYNSGSNGTGSPYYPWEDAWGARDIVSKLDAKISTAVGSVNNSRLYYVPVNGSGSPFIGHGICDSGASYFQNLDQAVHNEAYVFHPNATGQQKYADLMSAKINAS